MNPIAGRRRAGAVWQQVKAHLDRSGWPYRCRLTEYHRHAVELALEAAPDELVVGRGGDGTTLEIVNGLVEADRPRRLAMIPAGTGSDFARSVGIPREPLAALEQIRTGSERAVDLGRVNGRYFLNVAGLGFDAEVAAWANARPKFGGGALPYLAGILRTLFCYRPRQVECWLDGNHLRQASLLVAVGNGRYYGGGMMMCPHALVDDGLFDVCVAGDLGRLETLLVLPGLFKGRHIHHPKVKVYRAGRVKVTVTGPEVMVHGDGEIIASSPALFEVVPRAITVVGCEEKPDP